MKKRDIPWVGIALGALALFQGLAFLSWPGGPSWGLFGGGLGLVVVVGLAFWWALVQAQARENRHQGTLHQSLEESFDVVRIQTVRWLSQFRDMEGLSFEEQDEVAAELAVVSRLGADPGRKGGSVIDVWQTILLLHHLVARRQDKVFPLLKGSNDQLNDVLLKNRLNHFRLTEAVEFLTKMGSESSQYSEKIVLEVLQTFREITQFSQGIGTDVAGKVRHLMDAGNAEGLDAIHKESTRIQTEVEGLIGELSKANSSTEKAVVDNLDRMQRVQTMAGAIGDFSESIRMIALNLNIEAARASQQAGGNRKSFQVLAAKLSEFASRAGELAQQQQEAIATALAVVTESGRVQREKNLDLMAKVAPIKSRLEPFARIVDQTFHEFELVEASMSHLSVSIEEKLKAVLGRFQFQDLVRQEQEHILAMFAHIRDLAGDHADLLDAPQRQAAWEDFILTFERIATTENERLHIQISRKETPVATRGREESSLAAGSVALF